MAHRSAFGARLADAAADAGGDRRPRAGVRGRHGARRCGWPAPSTASERALLRLALPAAKYLVCKRTPAVVAEALECLGGNGYVEESGLPRLYREAPLNSIWEGSGNVTALDVLRAITREPESVEAVLAEMDAAAGADSVVRPRRRASCAPSCAAGGAAGAPAGRDAGAVPAGHRCCCGTPRTRWRAAFVTSPLPARRPVAHGRHAAGRGPHRRAGRLGHPLGLTRGAHVGSTLRSPRQGTSPVDERRDDDAAAGHRATAGPC